MEGHLSPDHRRQRIMRQHDPEAGTVKPYSDSGSDFIRAQDHGESKRTVGPHILRFSCLRLDPVKQEPGRAEQARNAKDIKPPLNSAASQVVSETDCVRHVGNPTLNDDILAAGTRTRMLSRLFCKLVWTLHGGDHGSKERAQWQWSGLKSSALSNRLFRMRKSSSWI
ncbi:MAG: hypothetical protein NVV83_04870 [Afipia sp.]|nr:hypothetical protein [Afipia sp.]